MDDPAIAFVKADLDAPEFQAGVDEGRWRVVEFSYPRLDFKISAVRADGTPIEFGFRANLSNYPAQAPEVKLWNLEDDAKPAERPTGSPRIVETFKDWGNGTVYRPWDRQTGPHNNNATNLPHLAWNASRKLTFIFEDLHGILASLGRTHAARSAA